MESRTLVMDRLKEINHSPLPATQRERGNPFTLLDETTVIPWLNQLLNAAIDQGASDIHFEPYEQIFRVRFRLDGLLSEVARPPLHLNARISARIKVLANLDTSERRLPQDGRFHFEHRKDHRIDFRINSCPTLHGEKIVIRILDPLAMALDVSALGLDLTQQENFLRALKKPQGMIILTGPTGSGKTSSLYAALNFLNSTEKNIATVEDPVEIKLQGINQIQINPNIDFTFAKALRALLRQDPDIIMVGEMRDKETADIALKAAQTGHLVLSTLHTNSVADTFMRLRMMGLKTFQLIHSISLIIAQRLIRCLCSHCRVPQKVLLQPSALKAPYFHSQITPRSFQTYEAQGCQHCKHGYQGRRGLFEVMPVSPTLQTKLMKTQDPLSILKQAQAEGMQTLWESGLNYLYSGLTTLEELQRVLGS